MAIKHNNIIPNGHFHKDWQRRVKVHFEQAGRKHRRRDARIAKAARVAPRPVDRLRPVVQCPTLKYNRRARAGRGFTLQELKAAGIPRKLAPTIGISVDHRRQTTSEETLKLNVERLQAYKARLILFPLKSGQHKKLDSSKEDVKSASDSDKVVKTISAALPIKVGTGVEHGISEVKKGDIGTGTENAYVKLRTARADKRYEGARKKRAQAKAEAEESKKK